MKLKILHYIQPVGRCFAIIDDNGNQRPGYFNHAPVARLANILTDKELNDLIGAAGVGLALTRQTVKAKIKLKTELDIKNIIK